MKKIFYIATMYTISVQAQSIPIVWDKTIGGNDSDYLNSIIETSDGGYLLGGHSESGISGDKTEVCTGDYDYWIVKTDDLGNVEWENTISGNYDDFLYSIIETSDGGYLLGGYSNSGISDDKTEASIGEYDYWIVKTDEEGNVEWDNTIGGSGDEDLSSIIATTDGGYLLAGQSWSGISSDKTEASLGSADYWIVKTDEFGNVIWDKTIGGNLYDELISIIETTDGGYLLGGFSTSDISGDKTEESLGYSDYWIVKTNDTGNVEWNKTIGGNDHDYLTSIIATTDGGYLLGGYSQSEISGNKTEASLGYLDYWIVKISETGNVEWDETIGGSNSDFLFSINTVISGGYLLGGFSSSGISGDKTVANLGYGSDYWIVKIDDAGNVEWDNTVGGSNIDELFSMIKTTDEGWLLGGNSWSGISGDKTGANKGGYDYWLVKLEGTGNCELPVAPGGIYADEISATSATIHWAAVPYSSGTRMAVWNLSTGSIHKISIEGESDFFAVPGTLTPGTTYGVRLKTVCLETETISEYSEWYYFTTDPFREGEFAKVVKIYPNPTDGNFHIQLNGYKSGNAQIGILNIVGQIVYEATINVDSNVSIHDLSINIIPGTYFIRVINGNEIVSNKMVIE